MLELVSMTVKNFRSFGDAEFAPLGIGQGMTAINGGNGAGKCLPGHTRVFDGETGEALSIEQFVNEQRKSVIGYSEGKVVAVPVSDWHILGNKPIVTVALSNGTSIDVAASHPILTDRGCVRAEDLRPGDWVAEPGKMPATGAPQLTVDEALLLGLLLGDGHFGRAGVSLTAAEPSVQSMFRNSVESVFPGLTVVANDRRGWQYHLTGMVVGQERVRVVSRLVQRLESLGIDLLAYMPAGSSIEMMRRGARGFTWETLTAIEEDFALDLSTEKTQLHGRRVALEWSRSLNLLGTRSATKFVPPAAMLLPDEHVRALLAGLWMTDGWFTLKGTKAAAAVYGTDSLRLALDVRTLLKRLGIASSLQTQTRRGKAHYRVSVATRHIARLASIPLAGPKRELCDAIIEALDAKASGAGMDLIPESFNALLPSNRSTSGRYRSAQQLSRHAMSRETYRDFGGPRHVTDAEILWTQVAAVSDTGREERCFDITVDTEEHLYVAENLIVHNSSIVHALVWACFGVTPDGVPVRALRRQGSDGDVEARVVFRHDGQTIEVVRGLRGRNDTTIAAITVDGVEQTNISAKTATAWMTHRLGLDAEAFLTAFVVRQKELDALVKARPADRRKTIERLAGIERMSAALDLARQDARAAKRLLDALPAGEDPAVTAAALEQAQSTADDAARAADDARDAAAAAAQTASDAEAALDAARSAAAELAAAQTALTYARANAENAAKAVAALTAAAAGADDLPHAEAAAEDARAARIAAEAAVRDLDAILARAAADADLLVAAETEHARGKARHDAVAARLHALPAAADVTALEAAASEASALVEQLTYARGVERGEWERLNKAIATLRDAADSHAAACPTCDHPLADPAALIDAQETLLAAAAARGQDISERLAAATADLTAANQRVQDARAAATERAGLTEQVADLAAALAAADLAVERAAEAAETSAEAAHEAQRKAAAATESLDALRAEETRAATALAAAQAAARAADDLLAAVAAQEQADAAAAAAAATVADLEGTGSGDVAALEQAARAAAHAATQARETAAEARTAAQLADRDLAAAADAHQRALAAAEGRKSALADVERTAAAADALEEFRRDRLARLAPELSEVASDFVARMTEGRYTAVELDEDFTPILTEASGAQRPAAWLSGGEESAVALALRVAIGEVLSGQRGGLLILDEVLTAQDTSRRAATMAAIRALPRQTVTINHVSEATDMVDLVAEVVPDMTDGSTIVTYTPDHVRAGALDDLVDA